MIYCVNPTCLEPQNLDTAKTCHFCGSFLQLRDRYLPQRLLGQGGSGRTFLAIDGHSLQTPQKLCVIQQSQIANQTKTQILKLVSLDTHLPRLIDAFSTKDHVYWVHEWIEGQNLELELTESEIFTEAKIWQLLEELLPTLKLLHEHQLIHQDINPKNIIRRSNGSLVLVALGSVAIASELSSHPPFNQVGSPEYAAPEQLLGRVHFASDLYSLGVTCLHLLTAISPFELFDSSSDRWVWQDYFAQPVSDALTQVLDQLTQRSMQQRFASAQAAIAAIQCLRGKGPSQPTKSALPRLSPLLSFPSPHTANINAIAIHPQLPVIASASDDKTIRLWNRDSQQWITALSQHRSSVRAIAFSPTDATLIASASDDKTICLWNWQTATLIAQLEGHQAPVRSLCFSPDGRLLISGSWDKTIGIWEVATATRMVTLTGHTLQINAVAVSRDGNWLASASADRTARLWQLQSAHAGLTVPLRSILVDHTWAVNAVAFSPDGQLLATGSNDNTIKFWQVQTGQLLRTLTGHSWSVVAIAFSPDGQHLLSASWDQLIKLWQVETGLELAVLVGHTDAIHAIAVACNPTHEITWIASGGRDRQIKIWQI